MGTHIYFRVSQEVLEVKNPLARCRLDPWVGKTPLRRAWQPTPAFLPGEYHKQRSLVGYSPWRCKEWDTTVAS